MEETYQELIDRLIRELPYEIDLDVRLSGRPPSTANSEFLTNKEQGDWAERMVLNAINNDIDGYVAVPYGRSDSLSAGDPGFKEFYRDYQEELNTIGKKPDLLVFRTGDLCGHRALNLEDAGVVSKAVAAIEVRSSSFLAGEYETFMADRTRRAEEACARVQGLILEEPFASALKSKSEDLHRLISTATATTFRELTFRRRTWSTTETLRQLSEQLSCLSDNIQILQKRDYLSITPKLEDLALVNRWIQNYNVPHYYVQVFFDKAYVISFRKILEICSDPELEKRCFRLEKDVKNQGKSTIKINVLAGRKFLTIKDMPMHKSKLKKLDRGRLLFYVTFEGGRSCIDSEIFISEVLNAA